MAQGYVDASTLGGILKEAIKNAMVAEIKNDSGSVNTEGSFTADEVVHIKEILKPALYGISHQIHMDLQNLIPWSDREVKTKLNELQLTSADVFNFYIAGGYIASKINDTDSNDIDIYFYNEAVIKFWHWLFNDYFPINKKPKNWNDFVITKIKENQEYSEVKKQLENQDFGNTVFVSPNAISIEHKFWPKKCQFIIGWYGNPKIITEKTFDLAHCMAYYMYKPHTMAGESVLTISPFIYRAAKYKMMYFNRPTNPNRLKKYYDRGYNFGETWIYEKYKIYPSDSITMKNAVIQEAISAEVHSIL